MIKTREKSRPSINLAKQGIQRDNQTEPLSAKRQGPARRAGRFRMFDKRKIENILGYSLEDEQLDRRSNLEREHESYAVLGAFFCSSTGNTTTFLHKDQDKKSASVQNTADSDK